MKILMIVAPQGYQPQEYADPKTIFEREGYTVITGSTVAEPQDSRGGSTHADVRLADVDPQDYDAVVFVGGPGCEIYYDDPIAHQLARGFYEQQKLTTAICAAPGILAKAGLLKGKNATCWPTRDQIIEAEGAHYTGQPVTQDDLLITGNGPDAAAAFGETIVRALKGSL